jgi:hypothetical protein
VNWHHRNLMIAARSGAVGIKDVDDQRGECCACMVGSSEASLGGAPGAVQPLLAVVESA